jgi:hypothetical protein
MKDKISVLIPTCDAYSSCWEGLGLSWEILSGLDVDVFVVSDSQLFNYEHKNFVPLSINKPNYTKRDFSNKIIYALDRIKTKYVLMMCDDMWPERSINHLMPKFLEFMENEQADCLRIHEKLYWWEYGFEPTEIFIEDERVLRMKQDSAWLLTHNAAIWCAAYLRAIQRPDEDPWNNEVAGTERAKAEPHKQYHYNIRWYLQNHNFYRGKILPYGQAFIEDLRYKKIFNQEYRINRAGPTKLDGPASDGTAPQ